MKAHCKDCKAQFIVSKGEQDFYKQKGFPLPRRCKECRGKRREEKNANKPFEGKLDEFKGIHE